MQSLKTVALWSVLLLASVPLGAHEYASRDVTVAHPWARAMPGGAKVGSVYLEMKAKRGPGDRLVAAHSATAGSVEVHSHIMEQGIAKMRRVDGIAVPGGKSIVLRPDGFHIMLIDLKEPLKEGDLTTVTLVFEKAGEIEVDATVEPIGATGPHGFKGQPPSPSGGKGHRH